MTDDLAPPVPFGGIAYTGWDSPLGQMWIASSEAGLVALDVGTDELTFTLTLERFFPVVPRYSDSGLQGVVDQIDEYLERRRRVFDLAVDLSHLRPLQAAVLQAVCRIPYGETRSYGEIAEQIGRGRAARAVGSALASSPIGVVVPCHRVIRSDGSFGEYGGPDAAAGRRIKRRLLELEQTVTRHTAR